MFINNRNRIFWARQRGFGRSYPQARIDSPMRKIVTLIKIRSYKKPKEALTNQRCGVCKLLAHAGSAKAGIMGADEQYFIDVIAVGKRVFECVGAVIFAQDLPVVVIVITPRVAGGDEVLFLYSPAERVAGKLGNSVVSMVTPFYLLSEGLLWSR